MKTKLVLLTIAAELAISAPFTQSMEKEKTTIEKHKEFLAKSALALSTFAQSMKKTTVEKHKAFLAQQKEPSDLMREVNKNFGKFILGSYPSKPANPFHQQLWKEAQNDLNIPEQYHAPIVAFDLEKNNLRNSKSDNLVIAGEMCDKMYIHDEIHNSKDDPLYRFRHYHEAAHHKYLDPFNGVKRELFFKTASALSILSTLGFYLLYPSSLSEALLTIAIPSILLSQYAIYKNLEKLSQLHERRADLAAAYAVKCDQCVQARADRDKVNSPIDQELRAKKGYLSWKELEAIAQEHKKNGLTCNYHKTDRISLWKRFQNYWWGN